MRNEEKMRKEQEGRQALAGMLSYCLRNNQDAVDFCLLLWDIAQVWDDLVDRDNSRSMYEISKIFFDCLISLQRNLFYQKYQNHLIPLIANTILKWYDSEILEREKASEDDLHKAYMLRAGLYDIFNYCAYLVGGFAWATAVGAQMRRMYAERYEEYREEIMKEVKEDA